MITQISEAMQRVLTESAEKAAKETGFIERQVKVTGANFCQTVVFGWLQEPEATLEALCQMGKVVGLEITPQGLDQRFNEAASRCLCQVLQAAVGEMLEAEAVAIPLLERFKGVYVEDSSSVTLPESLSSVWLGCGGNRQRPNGAVKLQVRWDMLRGGMDGPHLTDGRTHDRVASTLSHPLPEGSLMIRDLGYWKLESFDQISQAGGYWLSRAQAQTAFFDEQGRQWGQADYVRQQQADSFDIPVELGVKQRLPARLVGFRMPPAVAAERRRKLKTACKRKGQTLSADRLALCDWTLFVTNLLPDQLTPAEILVLARLRWQIELLFKLWKSHGHIDKSRSAKPWRILCELYAKLIGMLIQHWVFLMSNWRFPDRSLVKAATTVRRHVISFASGFSDFSRLQEAFLLLRSCLAAGARINKSAKSPRTFQLLLALDEDPPLA